MSDRQRYLNPWVFLKYAVSFPFNMSVPLALTYLNHYLKNGLSTALGEDVIGKSLTVTFEVRAGRAIWETKGKA